jgi:hypothetical protein
MAAENSSREKHEKLTLPKLVAVTGQEASGKDSYAAHLAAMGYMHVSAGDVLRERARAQGYQDPIERTVLSKIGDELKQEFGPSPIVESTLAKYHAQEADFPGGLIISGLRRTSELKAFQAHGAALLWIAASDESRLANQHARGRGDDQSDAAFLEKSQQEYTGTTAGGAEGVNLQAVEALADCRVENDGNLEDLYQRADDSLSDTTHN